jgi:hypothetical protein
MYFHLIGIKEKDTQQYQLDMLIGDEELVVVKDFLEKWKVVVISLEEYPQSIEQFGTIQVKITVNKTDFFLVLSLKQFEGEASGMGNPLEKALRFLFSLGLSPSDADLLGAQLPKSLIDSLIKKISIEYKASRELWEKEQEQQVQREQKKYEDENIKQALKVINTNIDRIAQMLEVGKSILTLEESVALTDLSNELKKIRLGSNFNRMVELLMDTQDLITRAEDKVLTALDDKKFLIDRHSFVTNIDVISEYSTLIKAEEKSVLKQSLGVQETVYFLGKYMTIFAKFFGKDVKHVFDSLQEIIPNILMLLEYLVLAVVVLLSIFWVFLSLFSGNWHLPYYLPMFGRLGFLLYLYNQCSFKTVSLQVIALVVLIGLDIWGVILLKSTFAF